MNITLKKKILLPFAGIVLLAGTAIYLLPDEPAPVMQAMDCEDIVKGCSGDGLAVRLSQAPKVMQPFRLEVSAPEADAVEATFNMAGMDMGFNRYRLVRQDDRIWDAEVTLPVCVRGRKDWLLLLDISRNGERRRVAVAFAAG